MGKDPYFELGEYGGMKSFGGLKPQTEYEVGIGNVFEELHCILGSLTRISRVWEREDELTHLPSGSLGHIMEEMDKLETDIDEYSRDLYLKPIEEEGVFYEERQDDTIEDLKENVPAVKERANKGLEALGRSELPYEVKQVAQHVYDIYKQMCRVIMRSLEDDELTPEDNVFKNDQLRRQYEYLEDAVSELASEYGRHRSDGPVDGSAVAKKLPSLPPPLTVLRNLKRATDGVLVDTGMRWEHNEELEGCEVFHSRKGPKGVEQIAIYCPDKDMTYYFERQNIDSVPNKDLLYGNGYDMVFDMPYGRWKHRKKQIWVWKDDIEEDRFWVSVRVPYESKDHRTKHFQFDNKIENWPPEKILSERGMTKWGTIPDTEEWNVPRWR